MGTREGYNEGNGPSSKSTGNALCDSFNKLQVRTASRTCFYEDYLLARTKLFLLQNDEVDPAIPSKLAEIIQRLKKFLQDVPLHIRRSKQCIEDFYRMLLFLQDYLDRYIEVFKQYPLSRDLVSLLIEYVELEYEVLYLSNCYSAEYQKQVENRILTYLLLLLYDPNEKKGTNRKNPVDGSAINALYVIKNVKPDYKREHDLIENLMTKLLLKLNVLDTMNEFRKGNVESVNAEKMLQVPRLQEISKQLQHCSYVNDLPESDDEIQEIDIPRPMQVKAELIEIKVDTSQYPCFNVEENLNRESDKKLNVDSNNSNKCKCGHYNCSISCNDPTILYISDDDGSSDIEITEDNPVPIIDLDGDEILKGTSALIDPSICNAVNKIERDELVTKEDSNTIGNGTVIDPANENEEPVSNNATIENSSMEGNLDVIEEKVGVTQYTYLNDKGNRSKDVFCDDVISVLVSDDEDNSDIEITGTTFIPTIEIESDERLKNDTVNKEVLPLTKDTNEAANNDNTIQSLLDQDHNKIPTNKCLEENVTKFDSINEKPIINNDSEDLPINVEQPRLDESPRMIHENKSVAEFISDSSTKSSDQLESTVNSNGLIEDVDLHEDISVDVNVQLRNRDLVDEETNDELTKKIIDQLESAIQDTETTSKLLQQNNTLKPQTETSLSEITQEMQYEHDIPIVTEEIVNESIEPEEIVNESIEPEKIVNESIEPEEIVNESIEPEEIVNESIEPEEIVNESIEPEEIVNESIEPEEIVNESIEPEEIVNESIEPEGIVNESIEPEEIVNESIEPEGIVNESIEPEEIVNESIEPEGIVNESIEPEEIVNESIEPEGIVNESIESEEIVNESIESEKIVNESIESEEIDTYSLSQNLAQEEIVEVDTMLTQEEISTFSEHLVDEETRGNSPNADSGVFDVSPVAVSEETLTPSYSYELTTETQFQNNEDGATDCIVRSEEIVEVHPDIEDYVDEQIIELQTTEVNGLNSAPSDQNIESDFLTTVEVTTTSIDCEEPAVEETENSNNEYEAADGEEKQNTQNETNVVEPLSEETFQPNVLETLENSTELSDFETGKIILTEGNEVLSTEIYTPDEALVEPRTEVVSTNMDFFANAATDLTKATDFQQNDSDLVSTNQINTIENEEKNPPEFEVENDVFDSCAIEPKIEHITDDYVHEETVVIEPCETFAEEISLNDLDILATAAAKRKKMEFVRVKGVKKSKKGRKKIKDKVTIEDSPPPRRVTRSTTVSKLIISNNDVQDNSKCIPSTFMNLENLVTPPPVCVYNLIPSTISDEESIDEPFSSVQNLQAILVRNVAFDEDTLDDNITLVTHEKEVQDEVIISIPESEKDYPGINYDILDQTEEFAANTNLSLSTSEELCKELKLTMTKNKEINNTESHQIVSTEVDNQPTEPIIGNQNTLKIQKNKKKTVDKVTHTVPIKKRRNYGKNVTNPDEEEVIEKPVPDKKQNLNEVLDTEIKQKRISAPDRPFPTKAALKCFQIPCNPYVQLQKLSVTCENTIMARQIKYQDDTKNREKRESRSLSESKPKIPEPKLKRRKGRRSTVDGVLNEDDTKIADTKITRRRMSSKFSCEMLMGIENGLEINEILENKDLTIKPKAKPHCENTPENLETESIVRTRSKSGRNKKAETKNISTILDEDILSVPQNTENVKSQQEHLKLDLNNQVCENQSDEGNTIEETLKLETDEQFEKKRGKKREPKKKKGKTKFILKKTRLAVEDKCNLQENVENNTLEHHPKEVLEGSGKVLDLSTHNQPVEEDKNAINNTSESSNLHFDDNINTHVIEPCLEINQVPSDEQSLITDKLDYDSIEGTAVQEITVIQEYTSPDVIEFPKENRIECEHQNETSQEIDLKSNDTTEEFIKSAQDDEKYIEQECSAKQIEEQLCFNDEGNYEINKETENEIQHSEPKHSQTEDGPNEVFVEEQVQKVSSEKSELDHLDKEIETKSNDNDENVSSTKTNEDSSPEILQTRNSISTNKKSNKLYFKKDRRRKYKELNKKCIKGKSKKAKIRKKTNDENLKTVTSKEHKIKVTDQKKVDKRKQSNPKSKCKVDGEGYQTNNDDEPKNLPAVQNETLDVNENACFHKEDVNAIPLPDEEPLIHEEVKFETDNVNKESDLSRDILVTAPNEHQESAIVEETVTCEDFNKVENDDTSGKEINDEINEISSSGEAQNTSSHTTASDHNLISTPKEPSLWTIDKIINTIDTENKIDLEKSNQIENETKSLSESNEDKVVVEHDVLITPIEPITSKEHIADNKLNEENKFDSHINDVALEEEALDLSSTSEKSVLNNGFLEETLETEHTSNERETFCEAIDMPNKPISEVNQFFDTSKSEDLDSIRSSNNELANNDLEKDVQCVDETLNNNAIENIATIKEYKQYMVNPADIVVGHEESIVATEDTLNTSSKETKINASLDGTERKYTNTFSKIKLKRRNSISTDTYVFREQNVSKETDILDKYDIECTPYKKTREAVVQSKDSRNDTEINKINELIVTDRIKISDQEDQNYKQETIETSKTEDFNVKEDGQCSDDEVVLVSVEKLPEGKVQFHDDEYAYDSEPVIDKLFEKYAKKKTNNHSESEASLDSITTRQKKIPNDKRVRFSMETNTVKRIFSFEDDTNINPSIPKKIKIDEDRRSKENNSQSKSKRNRKDCLHVNKKRHHSKNRENKSKDRKKETEVSNDDKKSHKGEKSNRDIKTETRKQEKARDRSDSPTKRNIDNQLIKKDNESNLKREKSVRTERDSRKRDKKRECVETTLKANLESPKKIKHVVENISVKDDKNKKIVKEEKCKKVHRDKHVSSKTKHSGSVDKPNKITTHSEILKEHHHKETIQETIPKHQKEKTAKSPKRQKENLESFGDSGYLEEKCCNIPNTENCETLMKTKTEEEIKTNKNISDTSISELQSSNEEEKEANIDENYENGDGKNESTDKTEVDIEQSKLQVTPSSSTDDNTEHQANPVENDQNLLEKEPEMVSEPPLEVVEKSHDQDKDNNNIGEQENTVDNDRELEKFSLTNESSKKLVSIKKKESRIDLIIENLKNKTQKDNGETFIDLMIDDKIDHEEHVESTIKPDNYLVETVSHQSEPVDSKTVNDLDKGEVGPFFPAFDLDQSKLQAMGTEESQCEDIFNENAIEIASSLAENSVSLLDVSDKHEDGAEASTSCEITDNLIAVMFSKQNRSNKTGFIFFKGSDHNYHSMGDPLLGGECDTNESDHSSDHKEIPSPELENVLVNDTILPYISTLTDGHLNQESSEDSGADFQLLELIGNTLARESSPPLAQAITCDNLYQPNLKQVELEYDENATTNAVEFSKINNEVFINQFQQQTMSVENMSELMNVVLTSIQNLNNMTKPIPILQQDPNCKDDLFLPTDLDLNDVIHQSQPQNLDLICDFSQAQAPDLSSECSSSNTPIPETDYSNLHFVPISYENAPIPENSSTQKVIVEHIPQYFEDSVKKLPQPEIITEKPSIKVTAPRPTLSETIAMAKQNIALSSLSSKKPLNNLGFVRNSSKTKPSAPKPKKICDSKSKEEPWKEVEAPIKIKSIESLTNTPVPKNFTSSPPKERSLPIIDDLTPSTKKIEVKTNKIKEDENCVKPKQSPAYTKSPRTPRQMEQKIESNETAEFLSQNQSDMIDNVKRRKRKPVDYSSIEKLLENDEYDYIKAQKIKSKKEDKTKGKQKEEDTKIKKVVVTDDAIPSTSSVNDDQPVAVKTKPSIFEDSDDDIPKKKRSKPEPRLEAEAMNALFDRLVKEGDINKVTKANVARDPPRSTTSSIFPVDPGLQKKPETTPVKQIGVVNPIPRQSNHMRKELLPSRGSYGASEESRTSSQYYPYYPERTRRSYPYSSRESRDSRPSSHQGSGRRPEYSTHSNDQRYSSQRSSSSSRSSRSSRHHSNSRSSTEQRGYWFGSSSDLSWREDMKKKFPNVFKDDFF